MIFYRDGVWFLMDMGSVNGTWHNKKRLTAHMEQPLSPGDEIDLAHTQTIIFLEGNDPAAVIKPPVAASPAPTATPQSRGSSYGALPPPMPQARMASSISMPSQAEMIPQAGMPPQANIASNNDRSSQNSMPDNLQPGSASAPKKGGLFSKFSSLFNGKSTPPDTTSVTSDDVQFRGTAPETITPGEYFIMKIMMYREDDYQRADRESASVAGQIKSASSSIFQANKGQQFRITLQSPDIELDCESQQLCWNGKFAAADFEVFLPQDYEHKQLRIRGRVYSGDAVLTDLKLILQISTSQPQTVICEKVRLRSAFISYASADRAKVVARIQGIQLACPDIDLFFDVESLRRGEAWEPRLYQEITSRDLFYLFWSQNAAASEWVQRELQYALSQKTEDYIEPIPLEGPDLCPPPPSLSGKHFNDWTLRYLNNQ